MSVERGLVVVFVNEGGVGVGGCICRRVGSCICQMSWGLAVVFIGGGEVG